MVGVHPSNLHSVNEALSHSYFIKLPYQDTINYLHLSATDQNPSMRVAKKEELLIVETVETPDTVRKTIEPLGVEL